MTCRRSLWMPLCAALATACGEGTGPVPELTVTAVFPHSGPMTGGTAVAITGTNLPQTIDSVRLGTGRLGDLVRASSLQLTGTTPSASAAGAVDVTVYATGSAGASSATCTGCFTYNPALAVTGVNPNNGPLAGGTAVTIAGTHFPITVDSVRVGSGRLGSLVRLSDASLTGSTPAGSATGTVDVTVFTSSAGNGTCAGCFTYNLALAVTSVSPNNGPLAGGTAVTITGMNFPATVDSVRIGASRLLSLVRTGGTQLTGVTAPGGAGGAADVTIFTTSAGSGTCARCFTYNPVPSVSSVIPGGGLLAGGTAVNVIGTNFPAVVDSVRIGVARLGSLARVSAVQLTGVTPPGGVLGVVDVTVFASSAGSATCAGCFAYREVIAWTSLAAGDTHTCGLQDGGVAYCWGNYNLLGDGTSTSDRTTPVAVAGGLRFASVTAGTFHTCGLMNGGAAYCWGWNSHGQLGDGSRTDRATPAAVTGGLAFVSLTAGYRHTCGVTGSGVAYCWGDNAWGQLGDGHSGSSASAPLPVAGGLTFVSLAAGYHHTCGISGNGAAYCWGSNDYGFDTPPVPNNSLVPAAVAGGLAFVSLKAGWWFTCGLTAGGAAYCWGLRSLGQLGDGTSGGYYSASTSPVAVAGGLTFLSLGQGGGFHTCGLTSAGAAYCWGANSAGSLGDGTTTSRTSPVPVAGTLTFAHLSSGGHTCGLTSGGAAYCWGGNAYGELGDGTKTNRLTPVAVANP